jgi:hypothetical protein
MRLAMSGVLVPILMAVSGPANAASTYWSAVPSSCVPDSATAAAGLFTNTLSVPTDFKSSAIGGMVFNCLVSPNAAGALPNQLALTYRDSSGASTSATVSAELLRVLKYNGSSAIIAKVSSDTSAVTGTQKLLSPSFTHQLDFDGSYYVVRLYMYRSSIRQAVKSYGVALEKH